MDLKSETQHISFTSQQKMCRFSIRRKEAGIIRISLEKKWDEHTEFLRRIK
ncbi:MAG: hypothetical protein ACK5XV_05765 [Flavobacteriales bacterium]